MDAKPSIGNSNVPEELEAHLGVFQQIAEGVEVVLLKVVPVLQVNGRHLRAHPLPITPLRHIRQPHPVCH